ncbi:MAG: phosphoglycerate kinase, partial [Nitrospiraceae bacterium]
MKAVLSDLPDDRYRDRRVFVRVDFNVPIQDGRVREDYRLRRVIPTIEYLSRRGARVILASHLGRPKGTRVPALSLKPVADRLASMLKVPGVRFIGEIVGEDVRKAVEGLQSGEV